jgi:hypothetical protein
MKSLMLLALYACALSSCAPSVGIMAIDQALDQQNNPEVGATGAAGQSGSNGANGASGVSIGFSVQAASLTVCPASGTVVSMWQDVSPNNVYNSGVDKNLKQFTVCNGVTVKEHKDDKD